MEDLKTQEARLMVAEPLGTLACIEQLELNVGLTTQQRRLANARQISMLLANGEAIPVHLASPKISGPEAIYLINRAADSKPALTI